MFCKYYNPYMDILKDLIGRYYTMDGCGTGGPLHILLDDSNYDIGSIRWCINYCINDLESINPNFSKHADILGIMICNEYAKMSTEERCVIDAYINGRAISCPGYEVDLDKYPPVYRPCLTCKLHSKHYEAMKNKENLNND